MKIDFSNLKFDDKGLIPAIVQDVYSDEVLMLAYMNGESLAKTVETGYTWFWSRSRQELWNKGATSGHMQKVESITYDCDGDALLVKVDQTGAACHTGHRSCFFNPLWNEGEGGTCLFRNRTMKAFTACWPNCTGSSCTNGNTAAKRVIPSTCS